jgi:hypothetical protein
VVLKGDLYAQIERLAPHRFEHVDSIFHVRFNGQRTGAVGARPQDAPHGLGANRARDPQTFQHTLARRRTVLAEGMAGRADAPHAGIEDHVVTGSLLLDLLQIRRLFALILVKARNLDSVELQTARIIHQLWGLPLEGAQRVSVKPELDRNSVGGHLLSVRLLSRR